MIKVGDTVVYYHGRYGYARVGEVSKVSKFGSYTLLNGPSSLLIP